MTVQAFEAVQELSASRLNWKRLRRLAIYCGLLVCAVGATVFYMNGGVSGIVLRADGLVLRERVTVARPLRDVSPKCLCAPETTLKRAKGSRL